MNFIFFKSANFGLLVCIKIPTPIFFLYSSLDIPYAAGHIKFVSIIVVVVYHRTLSGK